MWRKLKNVWLSFKTYRDLSPDLRVRRQVNQRISDRPALELEAWYQSYWQPCGIALATIKFSYTCLKQYSGLDIARIQPDDRLEVDLHWTEVCWFDWEMRLCEDFLQSFDIDLTDRLENLHPVTVLDLVWFLNQQLASDDAGEPSSDRQDRESKKVNF
jgi:hypothetical protein